VPGDPSPGAAVIFPSPFSQVTLFFLNRNSTPLTLAPTTSALRACIRPRSRLTWPTSTPCSASLWFASSKCSEDCSSALEGMQPTLRQVPPSVARFSTQATFMPSCAARMAQT
jgi:hypothetical protein